jgi:hypothetical protein
MQVIENYEQSCDKNSRNINGRCYLNSELSPICGTTHKYYSDSGICLPADSNSTSNFVSTKDGKCNNGYSLFKNNDGVSMCTPTKYIKQPKCENNFQEIEKNTCWSGKTKSTPVGCAPGDKLVGNECIAAPIINFSCPSGSKLVNKECITVSEPINNLSCDSGSKLVGKECITITAPITNFSCAKGDKLVGKECITATESTINYSCPPNPFDGKSLTYNKEKGLCA